jgi:hypothetical protein
MKKLLLLLTFFTIARILGDDCSAGYSIAGIRVGDFENSYPSGLNAKPILFIEHGMHKQSLEFQEIQNDEPAVKECADMDAYSRSQENRRKIVIEKMMIILSDLVKKYNACAVQRYTKQNFFCIDPAYDITKEAFDRLNTEYLDSKTR